MVLTKSAVPERIPKCVLVCPQLDKARNAYHKVSRKEQAAKEREAHAQGNPDVAIDKQKKIQEERELVQQEAEKVSNMFVSHAHTQACNKATHSPAACLRRYHRLRD